MPIAAKLEKQPSTEATEPLKMAMVVLEHKIRNLEKRKRKIEIYREDQRKGQTLNSDQLLAVSKFDEVTKTLDFAQDLCKQFQGIANESGKAAKKLIRKEALERAAQDVSKVKEILLIQDILQGMGTDNVREDFLAGRNNAIQLTNDDLKFLDDLYVEVAPKRPTLGDGLPPFADQLTAAAEHLLSIVEGKQKDVVGTSHEYLKQLFGKIQDCGYFDQNSTVFVSFETIVAAGDSIEEVVQVIEPAEELKPIENETQFAQASMPPAPLAKSLPIPSNLVPATTPAPTEVAYFAGPSHAPDAVNYNSMDQQKSVNDLIKTVTGSFNFLQESELDAPGLDSAVMAVALPVSTIPSQTYTNQKFTGVQTQATAPMPQPQAAGYPVVQPPPAELAQPMAGFATVSPNPPPPIPMPPSHRANPYAGTAGPVGPGHPGPVGTGHPGPVGPNHAGPVGPGHPGLVGTGHPGPVGPNHAAGRPEFHQEQPAPAAEGIRGVPRESWALGDAVAAPGGAGAGAAQGDWNSEASQPGEWAMPANEGSAPRQLNPRSSHRGNRGGPRGANSPGAYAQRGQSRPGNFHNGSRSAGSYGNYPRSQEGLGNASYYQHQNGYQQQHSQSQPQQQQPAQANREQFNTNGNYTSYRSRPAQRAPGSRGPSRGGMANDGGVSNQRPPRGTAFVGGGGGGGRPHMNRQ